MEDLFPDVAVPPVDYGYLKQNSYVYVFKLSYVYVFKLSYVYVFKLSLPSALVGELLGAIDNACVSLKLQPVDAFKTKVIQLFETFTVRFGVMVSTQS